MHHHDAYEHEGWSGGLTRDGKEQWREEQGQSEADGCGERGESAAATDVDTRGALYVSGDGGSAEHSTDGSTDGIGHEGILETWDVALLVDHACAIAHSDEGADGIEHVNEKEGEYADDHVDTQDALPLELAEDWSQARWCADDRGAVGDSQWDANDGGDEDAYEQCTCDVAHQEHGAEQDAEASQQDGGVMQVAQGDEGGVAWTDDARILEADEGDEEADAWRDGATQEQRHAVDDLLTQTGEGESDEDKAFDEDCGQGELPGIAHGEHDGVGEEGIEAHARSQREGKLCVDGHDQGGDDCRDNRSGEDCSWIHACIAQDARIDGQDVGHGEEGGDAAHDLLLEGHGFRIEAEEFGYHF